jgi:ankyrin repeat protein
MTALHWAAERGDAALAALLVNAGANVRSVTRLGDYTPLHIASRGGAGDVIEVLLDAGADPNRATSAGGVTPLHYAAASGDETSVKALLAHGAEVDALELQWSQTPLMFAAAAGRTHIVGLLAQAGADVALTARVMDMDGREQEDRADRQRQAEIEGRIRTAIEGGPPGGGRGGRGAAGGRGGRAAAAPGGRGGSAAAPGLTQEELNNQLRDRVPSSRFSQAQLIGGYGGLGAIHLAVRQGHEATVLALLDAGADINQLSQGDHSTPLLLATINGYFDLAKELLDRGADPNIASDANATPLYTTINTQWIPKSRHPQPAHYMQQEVTYLDLMKALLDAGVDPNVRLTKQLWFTTFGDDYLRVDRMGATPFWRAAYALDLDAMRLLHAYGADPNIPTMKTAGRSFGEDAGGGGRGGDARGGGPDPSGLPPVAVGGPGAYPIHAASGIGYGEGFAANIHRVVPDGWLPAVRYLVEELGADVNQRDSNGYNAVHNAASRGDDELIRYLVEKGADVTAVSRSGQTTVDMANGPVQRISPFPSTIALLESLGAKNNHNCVSCE